MVLFNAICQKWHLLFVAGEQAHSRGFGDDAHQHAVKPQELYIVPFFESALGSVEIAGDCRCRACCFTS